MASTVTITIRQWLPFLVALAVFQEATCSSLFSFPSVGSTQQLAKFPCEIVNATFVDCRNRGLLAVPTGIPKTTQTLLLSHNKIHDFTSTSLAGLVNLRLLNLSHNSISKLEGSYFADQNQLEHLYLSKNQINKIPGDAFMALAKLKTLDLSYQNNGLKSGFPGFLVPVNKTLTTLRLEKVNFMTADFGRHLILMSLKVLSLARNKITNLGKSDFQALRGSQLKVLDLSNNPIARIDTSIFLPFLGMGALDLTSSFIRPPPPSVMANVSAAIAPIQIQKLILRSLGLKNLTSYMFKGLGNSTLNELDLSVNEISELNGGSFGSQLAHLKVLQLYQNSIASIDLGALSGLTSLKALNIEKNSLKEIKPGTFKNNTLLRILNLSDNSIASLSPDGSSFQGLINLERLYLSKNKISQTLNGNEFLYLRKLTELDLSESRLKGTHISLTANCFKTLSKLKYMNLKKACLKDIMSVPSPFAGLLELRFLDVSNNNMDDFHPDTFASLKSLDTLYLDHNHFDNMWYPSLPHQKPVMFLRNLISLRKLDLSFNGLQSVPVGAFHDLAHLKTLHMSNNKLSVISGNVFEGLKELEYLDLYKNQINVVNQTMIEPLLKTLKILYICGNPFSCGCQQEWFRNWIDKTPVKVGNISMCLCVSPPDWRGKPLMSFHPEDLNCDGKLPLKDWILIGAFSGVFIVVAISLVFNRWKLYYIYLLVRASHRRSKRHGDYEQLFDFDAFISYSGADEEWVTETLVPKLENGEHPFKVCHHGRDFEPGKEIVDNIIQSVERSRRTICVISENYLESNWCSFERRVTMSKLFIKYKDVLILIIKGDIQDKKLSKYDLIHRAVKKKTYLKWPESADERDVFWQRLKDVLGEDRTPENYEVLA